MTTFKQYLDDLAVKTKAIDADTCIDLLKKYCSNLNPMFRGFGNENGPRYYAGHSEAGTPRESANTANWYTWFIDNSPAWAKYPKRARSFICSGSEDVADSYGQIHLIFPYDDAKVSICPAEDFWYSFNLPGDLGLDSLNTAASYFMEAMGQEYPRSYDVMKKNFEAISLEDMKMVIDSKEYSQWLDHAPALLNKYKPTSLFNLYEKILAPTNFKLTTGAQYIPSPESEVYMQGKAIIIKYDPDLIDNDPVFKYLRDNGVEL